MHWLGHRLYHLALQILSTDEFKSSILQSNSHCNFVYNKETEISAVETWCQRVFNYNFEDVAQVAWLLNTTASWRDNVTIAVGSPWILISIELPYLIVYTQVIQSAEGMFYSRREYRSLGLTAQSLLHKFRSNSRIIIVYTALSEDEEYPLQDDERRHHGYGWLATMFSANFGGVQA